MPRNVNLISTKLKMPSPRRNHIRREALFCRLDGIAEHRVTVIKGAAACGKTTLLSSYIVGRAGVSFRWLTLDRDLDDRLVFWHYFAQAVLDGEAREEIAALFAAAIDPEATGSLLAALINELGRCGELAIVLDDFHVLRNAGLLASLEYFIKNCPENVHTVLSTREEPQLYLGDLAVSGALLSIGEEELRFSDGEALEFLSDTLGLRLESDALGAMSRQAEGWVGGLQLLALASTGGSAAVRGIRGLGRYAVEYLQKEILEALPAALQDFMIKTSMLGSFDEDICNELFCTDDSARTIQTLLDKNLFLMDIGGERHSVRYHNIFQEFLQLRFAELAEGERAAFHLAAAGYYEGHGDVEESLRHLMKLRRYEQAMALIKRNGANYRVWGFLAEIPLEVLRSDRDLIIERIFYVYYLDGVDKLQPLFEAFQTEMENDEYWKVLKIAKAILCDMDFHVDLMSGDEIDDMDLGDTAKVILCIKLAMFLYLLYRLREALDILKKAEQLQGGIGNPFVTMSVLSIQSGVKEELGDLIECEGLYDRIFALMREQRILAHLTFNFHVGITGIYLKTGRLDKAQEAMDAAVCTAGRTDIWADAGYLYNLMELKLLRGDIEGSYDNIRRLLGMDFYLDTLYSSALVKYLDYMGRMSDETVNRYAATYLASEPHHLRVEDKLSYARILRYRDRQQEALELVDGLMETLRKQKIRVKLIEALLFKHGLLANGQSAAPRECMDLLREAVYYAHENRILSPFLLEGQRLAKPLLQLIEQRGRDMNVTERLFAGEVSGRLKAAQPEELLSEREREVLQHLATGASNKEIGERLFISLSTVKTHIINIYSKLQAGSRLEAVEKAKTMGLLG